MVYAGVFRGRHWAGWLATLSLIGIGCGDASVATGDKTMGSQCGNSRECQSGFCLSIDSTRSVCTIACTDGGGECPDNPAWTCEAPQEIASAICICRADAAAEVCSDGRDNDCDGDVDGCQTCNGRLVPLDDRANCGSCGHVCPVGATCSDGECACPDGACSDAGTSVECMDNDDCDDSVPCTDDTCVDQQCDHRVVPARCATGQICDLRAGGCVPGRTCATSSDCVDTDPCTTNEVCDRSARVCQWLPLDGDGDHDPARVCGGTDCDDDDPTTSGGAVELCDGADNDCDGEIDAPLSIGACTSDRMCMGGACQCRSGTECGVASCIDVSSDDQHCGGCFNACPSTSPTCITGHCIDANECNLATDNCDANATCTNADPGFTCACNAGYVGDGTLCTPDECAAGTDNCDVNATCVDTPTGFDCVCNAGYIESGSACVDRNECTSGGDDCDTTPDACVNTAGGFHCACPAGYTGDGVGTSGCVDDNECTLGTDNCGLNAVCTNTAGAFTCRCGNGYGGDGITCLPTPSLSDLVVSNGELDPDFGYVGFPFVEALSFQVALPLDVDTISITPTTDDAAEIFVNGDLVGSGTPWAMDGLVLGSNRITITVGGSGWATKTYTVDVIRGASTYVKAFSPSAPYADDWFGAAVAVSGNTLVVGAPNASWSANDSGAAFVYVRNNGTWSQQALLRVTPSNESAHFGTAVAISGDTIAVGVPRDAGTASQSGAVYVFTRSGTTWTQQQKLKATTVGGGDFFGTSVALDGDSLVVGAPNEDSNAIGVGGSASNNTAPDSGAAYVFTRAGTTWSQQAYVKASNTEAIDAFGSSVAISGDTIAVGAPGEDSNASGIDGDQANALATDSGAVYVFSRSGTTWTQQAYVKASNVGVGDACGAAVALDGDTLLAGAPYEDGGPADSGAAFVFVRSGTTWAQQAYVKANNAGAGDTFGSDVALSADWALVAAPLESGSANVMNDPDDDLANQAGAAYWFERSGTSWTQIGYLKASNSDAFDYFGSGVAVDGVTLAVGATGEDGSTGGINGGQTGNGTARAGAAYVY